MLEIIYFDSSTAKGNFLGNFGVRISEWNNIQLFGLSLLRNKEGKRFIAMPRKMKKTDSGSWETDFSYIVLPSELRDKFSESCIKAIDINAAKLGTVQGTSQEQETDEEIPF